MQTRPPVLLSALFLSVSLSFLTFGCSSGTSEGGSTGAPTVTPATVTSVSPSVLTAGAAGTTLTVTGTNFLSTSIVQVAGVSEPTTYVSATQLQASVPSTQFTSGALLPITVLNGTTASGSGATPLNIEIDNPIPALNSFSPTTFVTGSVATSVAITGSNFVSTSSVQINGTARPTTYTSASALSATLTLADLAAAGTLSVKIVNPAPGGGTSSVSSIVVNNPVLNPTPSGLTLSPATAIVGAASTAILVNGTGFLSSSVVNVNGVARVTTYVSPTALTFSLTTADQASTATLAITVTNPAPGGGTSNTASLVVSTPTPTPVISSVGPTQFTVGVPSSISVTGTNITASSVIQWNGTPLTTTLSGTMILSGVKVSVLTAPVPNSLLANVSTANITVFSPTPLPGTSNSLNVSVVAPPAPTVQWISPNYAPFGKDTNILVFGSNFTSNSVISFNGTPLNTTLYGTTSIGATISASLISMPGNGLITVTTSAPGGGTAAALTFTAYIPFVTNSGVYNPANGLYYVSVPSSVGAPYGNSVVSVDPATGVIGTPILVGSEPNALAISSDGTILWVGLDGAAAVRQVNLTTGKAGLQFSLGPNVANPYSPPAPALVLAALPGAPNSVIVGYTSASSAPSLSIFDNGIVRGAWSDGLQGTQPLGLHVDGTKQEIYAATSNGYFVYSYNASGLTPKTSVINNGNYISAGFPSDELQISNGLFFANTGMTFDAESGSLMGRFYSAGTTLALGPIVVDSGTGRAFILDDDGPSSSYETMQIQAFNTSDYSSTSSDVLPINGVPESYEVTGLARWGTNGLILRTAFGIFSIRSNLVKDLSTTNADLNITLAASGPNTTGSNTTYTTTIKNAGPSTATNVVLTSLTPSTGVVVSVTPSQGTCSLGTTVICDLGSLANSPTATVSEIVEQTTAGSATFSSQVAGSETDTNPADNQASSTATITGTPYNVPPAITSIRPAAIRVGASDTTITVYGAGFNSATIASLNGTALTSSVISANLLTALVPAADLTTLGWGAITVSTPAPGGGTSVPLPLSIFNVVTLGANHIIYDPFTRKLFASVGSGSSTVAGNSIAAITPETGAIGTPIPIGSQPTVLALSPDAQVLYASLSGSNSIARFNMLTQQVDGPYTIQPFANYTNPIAPKSMAVQTGSETALAVDQPYVSIYDFNTVTKIAIPRVSAGTNFIGTTAGWTSLQFSDAADLFGSYNGPMVWRYGVAPNGLTIGSTSPYVPLPFSSYDSLGTFKLSSGLLFTSGGAEADPSTDPAIQLGYYEPTASSGQHQVVEPDTSLNRVFFLTYTSPPGSPDGVVAYDQSTFLPTAIVPLNIPAIEGSNSYTSIDLIRWGQDGLAALTSGGHIYLLRGPVVVPQLLNQNTAATLTAATPDNITHGTGNTLITITGSNFIRGAAVTWNGDYRTTTWVDAGHLTVAIPASDLTAAGSATLVVTNPGATASNSTTFTIN